MIKSRLSLSQVKAYISALKEREVEVTLALGRNKFSKYVGVLSGVYPALFRVNPNGQFNGRTSYSYQELMCGRVRIKKLNQNSKKLVD